MRVVKDTPLAEITALLGQSLVYREVPEKHLARLASVHQERQFEAGETLIHEEFFTADFFIILDGLVTIDLSAGTGHVALAEAGVGETVGEFTLIMPEHRGTASVKAKTRLRTLHAKSETLLSIMRSDTAISSPVYRNIARILALRLARQNHLIGAPAA